jgi:hypothetical protein
MPPVLSPAALLAAPSFLALGPLWLGGLGRGTGPQGLGLLGGGLGSSVGAVPGAGLHRLRRLDGGRTVGP